MLEIEKTQIKTPVLFLRNGVYAYILTSSPYLLNFFKVEGY
jgi:hypothetical protein